MISDKRWVSDLALLGGVPAFDEPLHVGLPNTGDRNLFISYVNDILDRRWLTNNGRYVRDLEKQLAELFGVAHCVLVNNETSGLLIAMRALNLSGEVIVPSFTFVATVHALHWLGLKPIFCDVDPATHNLDPECVEAVITPQTSAILGVHLWGQPCAVERLTALAKKYELKLLYDAAHAFGSREKGSFSGNFGNAEIFSFHATKFFNTIEGGAITTNDPHLADQARLLRNFGFAGEDQVISLGINAKLNEISAAMGLTLLDELPDLLARTRRNYKLYKRFLDEVSGLRFLRYADANSNNCQYVVVEIDGSSIDRDLVKSILRSENVFARRYFFPGCHRMEPYRSQNPLEQWQLPVTERLTEQVLCLPSNATMQPGDIAAICDLLKFVLANGQEITTTVTGKEGEQI